MAGAEVEVRHVSRRFMLGSEEVWAVHDISLAIRPGEFVALIGRSGSGKTTLLNLMAGLDRPSEGEVLIDGERVDQMNERQLNELRRHRLGFVFQSFGLLPLLSAQENIELPLRIAGFRAGERSKRAKRVLEMVGLVRRAEHRPYELSGGEQQRVAIARALAVEPQLMLADEPTGELDSATATAIFSLLRDIARNEGITIITCTHDRLVMELASRIEELADGRLVTGQREDVWKHVQQKERSPFAAPIGSGSSDSGISSLIGADLRHFGFRDEDGDEERDESEAGDEPEIDEAEPLIGAGASGPERVIGQDTAPDRREQPAEQATAVVASDPEPPSEPEEEPEEGVSRWARPDRC